jgi:hypothetical protein
MNAWQRIEGLSRHPIFQITSVGLIATDGIDLLFVTTFVYYKIDYIVYNHARIKFTWWICGQDESFSFEEAFANTEIEQLQNVQEVVILTNFWALHINEIGIINRAH